MAEGAGRERGDGGTDTSVLRDEERRRMELEHYVESARAELTRYVERAADAVRDRPVIAITGALAIGYLAGKLASRRTR